MHHQTIHCRGRPEEADRAKPPQQRLVLAVGLARRKRRVLLIDGDPQANATLTMLNGQAADSPTLGQVLLDQAAAVEAIRPARLPRIDILPADEGAGRFRPVIDRATWTGTAIAIGPAPCRG